MKNMKVRAGGQKEHIKYLKNDFDKETHEIEQRMQHPSEKKKSLMKSLAKLLRLINESDHSLFLSKTAHRS